MSAAAPPARSREARRRRLDKWLRIGLPFAVLAALVVGWDFVVTANEIPTYILPRPGLVVWTIVADFGVLGPSLLNTLLITLLALALATIGGVALAIALTQSRIVEYSFFPIAVVLQVTPIVAIFPLINIYVGNDLAKLLICAWIVAFFPILSNTTLGLNSADRNLRDLYRLYGASRWQTLRYLQLPAAMPYFLGGLRIAGGLALIGAVVAEFVAGASGFGTGLASRIIESGYRLNIPRLFAALVLISATGILIYVSLSVLSNRILGKWHESAMDRGRR
ncbi:ABC transporter permease [Acuticoccus mangrovi]|uniref:ABC transporter permease n=1 Tax=Acuticoccus mangrovi TaxID=2796142 RepID=A0A934IFY2_9HYPH|nr:ABC transporter permease [Acuticoccus mangrovi]MBJ3775939.1 ABC transporter permease [Acuticoccus mangrovi]